MRLPPPVWMAGSALAQVALGRFRPTRTSTGVAAVLAVASLGLAVASVLRFATRGTTVDPMDVDRAQVLVTDGVNTLTRNPMYVGLAGLLAAHAVYRRSLMGLLPVLGFILVMDRWQIRAEEEALAGIFGAGYEDYRRSVPRWLFLR